MKGAREGIGGSIVMSVWGAMGAMGALGGRPSSLIAL